MTRWRRAARRRRAIWSGRAAHFGDVEQWGMHIGDFDLVEQRSTIEAVAAHLRSQR